MNALHRWLCQLASALYLDAGYILDSIWRRAEFDVHRYIRYSVSRASGSSGAHTRIEVQLTSRPQILLPRFWFFAVVIVFVAYGPTLDALCSVFGSQGIVIARFSLGALLVVSAAALLALLTSYGIQRANKRFLKAKVPPQERLRRGTVRVVVELGMITLLIPITLLGISLWTQARAPVCHPVADSKPAVWQLIVTVLALAWAAFGARRPAAPQNPWGPLINFTLLAVLTALLWLWIAAPAPSEAAQTPYPHVYAVFALAVAAVAAASGYWARLMLRSTIAAHRELFRSALGHVELFPNARTGCWVGKESLAIHPVVDYGNPIRRKSCALCMELP